MRFQIFRIDGNRLVELLDGSSVLALEEEHPAHLVAHHAVARVLRGRLRELSVCLGIFAVSL